MELVTFLIDFILHVDKHLEVFVQNYGLWVYALLFLIIFVETGVVVMPFLPGDSLLFVVGAMCGVGLMSLPLVDRAAVCRRRAGQPEQLHASAVISGRGCSSGKTRGSSTRKPSTRPTSSTRNTVASPSWPARFMPFLRTFAPFVAGVAQMTRSKFSFYDVTGGALWVGGIVTAGYFFGSVPWVKANLDKIIWAMILIPGLFVLFGAWKARRKTANA